MKYNIGDLFVIKHNEKDEPIKFIVLQKDRINGLYHYKIHMYYPQGMTKIQYLDLATINHFLKTGEFSYYPVIK